MGCHGVIHCQEAGRLEASDLGQGRDHSGSGWCRNSGNGEKQMDLGCI